MLIFMLKCRRNPVKNMPWWLFAIDVVIAAGLYKIGSLGVFIALAALLAVYMAVSWWPTKKGC